MLRGHLPANPGPPFRGASAELPQTFREQIPSAKPSACFRTCGAVHIFKNNVPLPTKLACGKKKRRSSRVCGLATMQSYSNNARVLPSTQPKKQTEKPKQTRRQTTDKQTATNTQASHQDNKQERKQPLLQLLLQLQPPPSYVLSANTYASCVSRIGFFHPHRFAQRSCKHCPPAAREAFHRAGTMAEGNEVLELKLDKKASRLQDPWSPAYCLLFFGGGFPH